MFPFVTQNNVCSGSKSNMEVNNSICSLWDYDAFQKWFAKLFEFSRYGVESASHTI